MRLWLVAGPAILLAVGVGPARAENAARPLTVADDLSLGPTRYLSNATAVTFAPAAAWSIGLTAGVTNTTTPQAESNRSIEVDGRVDASPAVALELGYTIYTGDLSSVYGY